MSVTIFRVTPTGRYRTAAALRSPTVVRYHLACERVVQRRKGADPDCFLLIQCNLMRQAPVSVVTLSCVREAVCRRAHFYFWFYFFVSILNSVRIFRRPGRPTHRLFLFRLVSHSIFYDRCWHVPTPSTRTSALW